MGSKAGKQYEDNLMSDWSAPPPWFLFKIFNAVVGFLQYLLDILTPPPLRVAQQGMSFIPSAWLCMTAQLGIPDLLKDGPLSASEIALELGGLREDDIYRGLRLLVNFGYFNIVQRGEGQPVLFRNNASSAVLRSDHPNSFRHLVMTWHAHNWKAFNQDAMLWHLQQKGGDEVPCAFEYGNKQSLWEYLRAHPEYEETFSKAMESGDMGNAAMIQDFRWSDFKRVVDIGGANGTALAALLQAESKLDGILFEQPQVIEKARQIWKEKPEYAALQGRVKLVGGDFFKPETTPSAQDGDIYLMRTILHDWSDADSVNILKSMRKAIGTADARIAILEFSLIPEFGVPRLIAMRNMLDMLMHAVVRGKERTEEQWKRLFDASGFKLVKCHPTRGNTFITEARPI